MVTIRPATVADAAAIVEIYRYYVLETAITFEYEVPSVAEFQERIAATLERYPYLVAEVDGQLLGYAYAGVYKGRSAYDWSCEVTVYLAHEAKGKSIGTLLYDALEELLAQQQLVNLTACITGGNAGSVAFHEKRGYQQVAVFPHIGYKFNQWHDVLWLQKTLQAPKDPQPAFIPYPDL